jgi:hypothetical protein
MALNWEDLQRMKRVEARADALGFEFRSSGYWASDTGTSSIYVKPKDDSLPIYSRTATFFTGSLEHIDSWLDGIEWARHYDSLLKVSNHEKRTAKEQQERNRQLLRTIKTGRKVEGMIGISDVNELRSSLEEEFGDGIPF